MFYHPITFRVVRGCPCFMGSTQYTQFLHEFSSLIRMDNDWHAEATHYLVEKRIGQCAVLSGNGHAFVHLEKQSTITRTYLFPCAVVTDISNKSIATRSHLWPTSTCPMGALRGHGDFRARQIVHDAMYVRLVVDLANKLYLVTGIPYV